ncbi:glucuronate isomerase [bacterium]|nr:MAG: glucuronate isomerase [bacterium]
MKTFITPDFLLETKSAQRLYHEYAADLPIIDYHCHLSPKDIATNRRFNNLSEVWLHGDHYKWRAMRTNGVSEKFITGNSSDKEKFEKWAETVPATLRNPLYHWTHLELLRYFGIDDLLNADSAPTIYEEANQHLSKESHFVKGLLKGKQVEVVCSTDDPIDSLEWHQKHRETGDSLLLLPAFRPDKAMDFSCTKNYSDYVDKLEQVSGMSITNLDELIEALQNRHDFFHENGCRLSDHGLNHIDSCSFTKTELDHVFIKARHGKLVSFEEGAQLRGYLLIELAKMDHKKNWVQQFHLGAMRNNSTRMMTNLGPDTGFDSIGDYSQANTLASFFNQLDAENKLAKTILYNLNPADNEVFATMIGNFNDGSVRGKMQWGSAWWFLDQLHGMEAQLNALSNMGLLSAFVGMLTDSRSFLSYPRHEYFRRLLCNILGREMEKGLLPMDFELVGDLVKKVSYTNAKEYFQFADVKTSVA